MNDDLELVATLCVILHKVPSEVMDMSVTECSAVIDAYKRMNGGTDD